MGGYAAIRAGLALRADTVLAFGPQVVLDSRERAALSLRASPFDRSLRALEAEGKAFVDICGEVCVEEKVACEYSITVCAFKPRTK